MRRTVPAAACALLLPAAGLAAPAPKDYASLNKPSEIYAAYLGAKAVAAAATKEIEADPALHDHLLAADNRADKAAMRAAIEKSTAAATGAALRTVLANFDYFWIDSYEGGLDCGVAQARWLEQLERQGPSEESWKLRRAVLDGYARLDMPWCEGLCEAPSFDSLVGALTEAKKVYGKKPYRARLSAWTAGVAARLERELRAREKRPESSPEQSKEVRGWIDLLGSFAQDGEGAAKR